MTAIDSEPAAQGPLFEIKAGSIHLPILKLLSGDTEAVALALGDKVRQAPDFFRHAPMIIDLHELPVDREDLPDFAGLVHHMRIAGLVPVGIRGGDEALQEAARMADLAILADTKHEPAAPPKPATPEPAKGPVQTELVGSRLIEQPVRSGQRIYAPGGDLVVLSQVSAGAEIMADGNIHVYGTLRGRALAGVQGRLSSRIFCMDLQAELISIGGHYKVSENLDDSVRGRPVQIYFRDNLLIIEDL
jgi:septum site-determining protein MinC